MRYILRINEVVDTLPEMEVVPGNTESNYAGLNRAEVLALIDLAIENDNFREAKELLAQLHGVQENGLFNYSQYTAINESVQDGKVIVQKLADEETRQLTTRLNRETIDPLLDEEKAARLAEIKERVAAKYFGPNSDFEKIKRLLHKNPMWVGAFTRFKFEQGATITGNPDKPGDLDNLQKSLIDLRDSIEDSMGLLDQYSKMQSDDGVPSFEKLGDYLTILFELRRGMWIVKALPKDSMKALIARGLYSGPVAHLREEYKKADRAIQLELLTAAAALSDLNKPMLIKLVTGGLSGKPSIAQVLASIKNTTNSAGTDYGKLIEIAMAAYPSVVILYAEGDYLVFSFRNDSQLPFLCGKATRWCIQPNWYNESMGDRFWNYATGSLQIGILDFTVDQSDVYHTVGVTISPDKKIKQISNQPNNYMSADDYRTVLQGFNCPSSKHHSYPQEVIDAITENFDRESQLKAKTDPIYTKIKKYSEGERSYEEALSKTLIGLVRDMSQLTSTANLTTDSLKSNSEDNIANQVIASEIKNLRGSKSMEKVQGDYIHKYTQGNFPIPSAADVKIFEIILEGSPRLTVDILNRIIQNNQNALKTLDINIKKIGPTVDNPLSRKIKILQPAVGEAMIALEVIKEKLKAK